MLNEFNFYEANGFLFGLHEPSSTIVTATYTDVSVPPSKLPLSVSLAVLEDSRTTILSGNRFYT